jgi:site-specific recombinase XerD
VLRHACGESMRAKRDYAMLAMLFGCGFRRSELVGLELDDIQMHQGHQPHAHLFSCDLSGFDDT